MYKLLIFLFLAIVKSEVDIEWFKGKWPIVVQYPAPLYAGICQTLDFLPNRNVNCTCGDKSVVPFDHIAYVPNYGNNTATFPVIIVESSTEVENALNKQCKCNNKDEGHFVYRKVDNDTFVKYNKPFYLHLYKGEPNVAQVAVKTVLKLSQLREKLKNIDDLSQRIPTYLCEPNYFKNEFEDLD